MTRHQRIGSMGAALALTLTLTSTRAHQDAPSADVPPNPMTARDAQGGNGADLGPGLFATADTNLDGGVTRAELKTLLDRWAAEAGGANGAGGAEADWLRVIRLLQPRLPLDSHLWPMLAALPERPAAPPARARKVLVFNHCAGFFHTPIPLTARMIEEFGKRTGAWSTTITFDPADINEQNLRQYDAVVLNSNTGAFLDDPSSAAVTAARRKALIDFVRGGKGLVGVHGATDAYHMTPPVAGAAPRGGGRGGPTAAVTNLAAQIVAQGDKDADTRVTGTEASRLADAWFDALDTPRAGSVRQSEFVQRITAMTRPAPVARAGGAPAPAAGRARAAGPPQGPDSRVGTWPEYNAMIGGIFKFHFSNQPITIKVDDPASPLTAMFKGAPLEFRGEIYTHSVNGWSRERLRVLTSVDYSKMSEADRAKESYPRPDQDHGLSWIRRDGSGRVFYMALGNEERVFFVKPLNEHFLAGLQYALGDLKADDSPSVAPSVR